VKIGIVIGSIRTGRRGEAVARWVADLTQDRGGVEYEVIDLATFDLPLLTDEVIPAAADRDYSSPQVRAWSKAIDAVDGFVFVSPEYNHGIPGAFKNAFDSIYPEWANKAVTFVAYGAAGGVRVVEHWRGVVANAHLYATRGQVALSNFTDFAEDGSVITSARLEGDLTSCLDQLEALAGAVAVLR